MQVDKLNQRSCTVKTEDDMSSKMGSLVGGSKRRVLARLAWEILGKVP